MSSKGFLGLIAAALLFGGSIGGAFIAGLALGQNDETEGAAAQTSPTQTQPSDQPTFAQLQERLRSGEITQEDLAQLRQQLGAQGGQGSTGAFGGGGGFGGAGLSGVIESVQDGTLTVNTAQGPLQASIGEDTVVRTLAEISPGELQQGMQVTVNGERGEDGIIRAVSITLVPEGQGLPVGGFGGRGGGGRFSPP